MIQKYKFQAKIDVLDFNTISKNTKLIKTLRKLTLHPGSGLNYELDHIISKSKINKVKVKIITASHDDKIVGWALLSRENSSYSFMNSYDGYKSNDGVLFEIFVSKEYRRKGIGSQLIISARKHSGPKKLCIAPWNDPSYQFYDKFKRYKTKEL